MAVTAANDKAKQARAAYNKGLERKIKPNSDEFNSLLRDLKEAEAEQAEIMQSAGKPKAQAGQSPVQMAREISDQNPTWTKDQVIEEVKKRRQQGLK